LDLDKTVQLVEDAILFVSMELDTSIYDVANRVNQEFDSGEDEKCDSVTSMCRKHCCKILARESGYLAIHKKKRKR